ncbi:hypothetical protein MKX01_010859 [Papaver californicum]|nr:hypothetical protein MKX01_010859 [Papaver californicum]
MFDMEYARWLEEDQQHMSELRTALQSHLSDNDLRILLDGYLSHCDQIFHLKRFAKKSDVFHLCVLGMFTDATMFDMEYARWLEEDQQHMSELRTALQSHLSDNDLRILLDGYLSHYDQIFHLKRFATKSDIFHLITGMWTTPSERCLLWMGGF